MAEKEGKIACRENWHKYIQLPSFCSSVPSRERHLQFNLSGPKSKLWQVILVVRIDRAEQVIESKSDTVVTGCSFCYGMMNQGLGPLTPENQDPIKVKDVADLVAENLR